MNNMLIPMNPPPKREEQKYGMIDQTFGTAPLIGPGVGGGMIAPTFGTAPLIGPGVGGGMQGQQVTPDMLVALRSLMNGGMGNMGMANNLMANMPSVIAPGMNGGMISALAGQMTPGQPGMAVPPALVAAMMGMNPGGAAPMGGPLLGNWMPQLMAQQNMNPGTPPAANDIPAPTATPQPGMYTATGSGAPAPGTTPTTPTNPPAQTRGGQRSGGVGGDRGAQFMAHFQNMFGPDKANLFSNTLQSLRDLRTGSANAVLPLLMGIGGKPNAKPTGSNNPPSQGNG